jgi:hypothetical protein
LSFNNKGGIELGVCPGHAPGYHASRPCMSWPIRVRLFHFANGTRERYGNRSRQFRSLEFLRRWCGGGCDGGCACSCGVRRPSGVGGSSAGSGFVMSVVADSTARACPLGHLVFFLLLSVCVRMRSSFLRIVHPCGGDGRVLYWTSFFDVGGASFCFPGRDLSGSIDIRSSFLIRQRGGSGTFAVVAFFKVWSYASVMAGGCRFAWASSHLAILYRRWWSVKQSTGRPACACVQFSVFFRGLRVIWACTVLFSAIGKKNQRKDKKGGGAFGPSNENTLSRALHCVHELLSLSSFFFEPHLRQRVAVGVIRT